MNSTLKNIPTHLGIILDGNRRWAEAKGIPKLEGHRRGYENFKKIAIAALDRGVSCITAYVFSAENWERPEDEVKYLMDLFLWVATKEVNELHDRNVRLRILGSKERLSDKLIKAIAAAEEKTKDNTAGTMALCLSYGGQQEIVEAVRSIAKEGTPADQVTTDLISSHLYAPDLPSVDLVIRTSGEQRISNFMLWRIAYSEFYFSEKNWPDFNEADLDKALADYSERTRRFGA